MLRQVVRILQFGTRAAEHDRHLDLGGDRLQFGACLDADEHDAVDTGIDVGACAPNAVLDPVDTNHAGAPEHDQVRILAPSQRRLHLADALLYRQKLGTRGAEAFRQQRVFDRQAGHTRRLEFLDGALDVEGVTVAVIGIDDQRQFTGAANAMRLVGKFGERQQDDVGIAQHREGCGRARKHAGLEAQVLGHARRERIVNRSGMNTAIVVKNVAQPASTGLKVHDIPVAPEN